MNSRNGGTEQIRRWIYHSWNILLELIILAVVILVAAVALDIRDRHQDRRRQAIARQNARHPHPSTRWLTPSTEPFDRTRPNRYTVPAQRGTR